MTIQFSPVLSSRPQGHGGPFSVRSIDLSELGPRASPVLVFDDFRVSRSPFGPHPHAGFSAVSYVLQDSRGGLRSRDSLGNDVVVGPGGIVWTQAGSGVLHDEVPAEAGRELHGLQIFVNLSAKNKLAPARVLSLAGDEVPVWQSETGDRVRVVVGSFEGVASPLVPLERFTLLDVTLRRAVTFDLERDHNALVYVLDGTVRVRAGERGAQLTSGQALALHANDAGRVTFETAGAAHVIVLSGAELREPVVAQGPFIMNDRAQIDAAFASYRRGEMGELSRL